MVPALFFGGEQVVPACQPDVNFLRRREDELSKSKKRLVARVTALLASYRPYYSNGSATVFLAASMG